MKRKRMDFAIFWLVVVGPLFFATGLGIWGFTDGNKMLALWIGSAGLALLLLAATLNLQQRIWEADAPKPLSPEAAAQKIVAAAQAAIQRAWVSVRPQIAGQITRDSSLSIQLITDNVGKEPATGVSHLGQTMIFPMPDDISYAPDLWSQEFGQVVHAFCDGAYPTEGRMTIFPGDKPALTARWDNVSDIGDLIDGKKILVTFGCLGYLTMGSPHYTWYCFFLMRDKHGEWRLGSAPVGNGAT